MKSAKKMLALMCALLIVVSAELIVTISAQAAVNSKNESITENEITDGDILSIPDTENVEVGEISSNPQRSSISYSVYLGSRRYFGVVRYYNYYCYKNSSNWYVILNKQLQILALLLEQKLELPIW